MPFNVVTGTYTPPAGATNATTGQVIQSAIWSTIHADLSGALTLVEQQVQATYGQRNIIGPNGGMEIWQRGAGGSASFAVSASTTPYTADRWYLSAGANQASTVTQVTGIVTGSRWAAKVQRNSGQTGTVGMFFGFPLDSDECAILAGQIAALSFVAKAGANWSPAGGDLQAYMEVGTGSPIKFSGGGGYSGNTTPINLPNASLTTSAARFTFVSTLIPSTTTQAEVGFFWTPVGTAGVDDSFTIDDVQLEILPNANSAIAAFERWPFDRMLEACKRHFQKTFVYGTAPAQSAGTGLGEIQGIAGKATTGQEWLTWRLPISMRTAPQVTLYNPSATNGQVRDSAAAGDCSSSAPTPTAEAVLIGASGNGSTAVGNLLVVHAIADAGI